MTMDMDGLFINGKYVLFSELENEVKLSKSAKFTGGLYRFTSITVNSLLECLVGLFDVARSKLGTMIVGRRHRVHFFEPEVVGAMLNVIKALHQLFHAMALDTDKSFLEEIRLDIRGENN